MSRLTSLDAGVPVHPQKVGPHAFRRFGPQTLVSNPRGEFAWLAARDYAKYLEGALEAGSPAYEELKSKGFLREFLDFDAMADVQAARDLQRWPGPRVHTIVVTRRCNFKCAYCHASVVAQDAPGEDMSVETAKAVVDFAFASPNPELMLEFQGGEPLLNWPVVKFIVEYAREKNKKAGKVLHIGLISNFSLLDDAKKDWLIAHGVSFCTSLDGPEDLHNHNRTFLGGNSHAQVVAHLKDLVARRAAGAKVDTPNAICTVTRASLKRGPEIVDQLVALGLERVQLGPLDPIGFARRSWGKIGYSSAEYLKFYADTLDHILALNAKGVKVYEKTALVLLIRILRGEHWRFPNGDVLARLAYNHDGGIYTSEEGRLLANEGDAFFRIGEAGKTAYTDVFDHAVTRASTLASRADAQPMCRDCVYQGVCTVQPVYNYQTQGGLFGRMPDNGWCAKMMGVFDILFERLRRPETEKILRSWLEFKDR